MENLQYSTIYHQESSRTIRNVQHKLFGQIPLFIQLYILYNRKGQFCKIRVEGMQRYICSHCDDFKCESSICPICGNRTTPFKTMVFWCEHCGAPSYEEKCDICGATCKPLSSDIRPVFPEERLLIEILLNSPMKYKNSSCYSSGGGVYFFDGVKVKISQKDAMQKDPSWIISQLELYQSENEFFCQNFNSLPWVVSFVNVNRRHLNTIVHEASGFIRDSARDVPIDSMFVSFSGGKDSTVTSSLVLNALCKEEIVHIYGDTTLEYPESVEYISRYRKQHPRVPMITAKNKDQDFFDLCNRIGPPSRVLRWCCTVFKTGAINRKIELLFGDKTKIVAFHGIRRSESNSRSKYDRVSVSPKITKQVVCQPIIDWLDFDVWLYLLSYDIDFNSAYRHGFSRVGCWCCPNNTDWAGFLSSIYMNDKYVKFREQLYSFARNVGKPDWKEYVDTGKWKARQGGNGLEYSNNSVLSFKPCVVEENTYSYELTRSINDHLYNLFVPFGIIDKEIGNQRLGEVFVLDRSNNLPLLKFTGKKGQNKLRVTVVNYAGPLKKKQYVENFINAQLTKFQMCIGCSACAGICKHSAIVVENMNLGAVSLDSIHYEIKPSKCVGCLECILHFDSGCYMKKVLRKQTEK